MLNKKKEKRTGWFISSGAMGVIVVIIGLIAWFFGLYPPEYYDGKTPLQFLGIGE